MSNNGIETKATTSRDKNKSKLKHQESADAKFIISDVYGDLSDAPPDYSFACLVQDMAMDASLGNTFRKMFDGIDALLDQIEKPKRVAHLKQNGSNVYFLITNAHRTGKPSKNSLKRSLLELKVLLELHKVKKLAIPEIGCGQDRLNWSKVKELVKRIFFDTDVHVQVYHCKNKSRADQNSRRADRQPHKINYSDRKLQFTHLEQNQSRSDHHNFFSSDIASDNANRSRNSLQKAGQFYSNAARSKKNISYIDRKQQSEYGHHNSYRSSTQGYGNDNGMQNYPNRAINDGENLQDRGFNNNPRFVNIEASTSETHDNSLRYDIYHPNKNNPLYGGVPVADHCTLICIKGDLFDAPPEYSLAHCVGSDFLMSAGIAIQFRRRFCNVGALLDQRVDVGGVAFLYTEEKYIYYLVTKRFSRGKPTIYHLRKTLLNLRDKILEHGVQRLAIPMIGCGLDLLKWDQVKQIILEVFYEVKMDINVYSFNEGIANGVLRQEKKPFTPRIRNIERLLKDLPYNIARFFLCCENSDITPEMTSFNEKYMIINEYRSAGKMMGEVVRIETTGNIFYGLVCRKSLKHPISFMTLEKCMDNFNFYNQNDKFESLGIKAFEEKSNDIVIDQVINIIKNCTKSPCCEIWVCWPQNLKWKCREF